MLKRTKRAYRDIRSLRTHGVGVLLEPMAVIAVQMQPMIKSTIMTVAAVAARLTVLCRDCLSDAIRGTETCAVPTVREDGIELVMLTRPNRKDICQ